MSKSLRSELVELWLDQNPVVPSNSSAIEFGHTDTQ